MQAAGDFIAVVVELSAGVENRHDDFGRGDPLLVHFGRNPPTVVGDGYRFADVDRDLDLGAKTGQRFIDGVVHQLENHVVQTGSVIGVADIHSGPLSDRVETLQDLDAFRVVIVGRSIFHSFLQVWTSVFPRGRENAVLPRKSSRYCTMFHVEQTS